MRCHTCPYWCARAAAALVVALACVASWPALVIVHAFLSRVGVLRFELARHAPTYEATVEVYAISVAHVLALAALAWGLWTFRAWAWWLSLGISLLLGLCILFLIPGWLIFAPVFCVIYILLTPSYPIFAEPDEVCPRPSTCSS